MKNFWKKYHKWVGLFFSFFILMFCYSITVHFFQKLKSTETGCRKAITTETGIMES